MIGNLSDRKFIIHPNVVNLRKNFFGLMKIVEEEGKGVEFFNNTAIVFINRRSFHTGFHTGSGHLK